jgi:hypothetical protein
MTKIISRKLAAILLHMEYDCYFAAYGVFSFVRYITPVLNMLLEYFIKQTIPSIFSMHTCLAALSIAYHPISASRYTETI